MAITDGIGQSLGGIFGNSLNMFKGFDFVGAIFWTTMTLVGTAVLGWLIYSWFKSRALYTNPVTLTKILDNGTQKDFHGLAGGVFWNKGIKDFKIKIPRAKPHVLGFIPDFSKADVDGRLHFITSGDGTTWQQYEKKWVLKEPLLGPDGEILKDDNGNIFEYDLINKPVSREVKQTTINSIKNWRDTVDKQKLTAWSIAIGAFVIMTIAHLVSLYIQTRIKCGVPAA